MELPSSHFLGTLTLWPRSTLLVKRIRLPRLFYDAFFAIVRTEISTFSAPTTFKLNVTIAGAPLQIPVVAPAITLGGRQSKLIITDYSFGASSKLSYSTAQIFYASTIDNRDVLFLYGDSSQEHEVALRLTGTPNKLHNNQSSLVQISTKSPGLAAGTTMVNFLSGIEGLITVWDSDTQLVLFADSETTATFWSPVIAGKSDDPLRNFWGLGTNQSILVGGPYLVRGASLVGSKLALRGDLKTDVRLTVIAPKGIQSVTWNGENVSGDVAASSTITQFGGFVGQLGLRKAVTGIKIPKLSWKFKDSLPEIQNSFNDGSWTIANHTTTNIPLKPYYGDGKILYGCDYGLSVTFSSFPLRMCLHVLLAARMSYFGEDISRLPVSRRALIYQSMAEKVFILQTFMFSRPDLAQHLLPVFGQMMSS